MPRASVLVVKKGLEDAALQLGRDSDAGVPCHELDAVHLRRSGHRARSRMPHLEPQLAAARHRIARIDGEVHDDLLEQRRVGRDLRKLTLTRTFELDRLAEDAPQHRHQLLDHVPEIDPLGLCDLPAAEREQLPRERRRSLGGLDDLLCQLECIAAGLRPLAEHLAAPEDHRQVVVEVVRDATGEAPDCLHLLGLPQLLLELAALRYVLEQNLPPHDLTVLVVERSSVGARGDRRAEQARVGDLDRDVLTSQNARDDATHGVRRERRRIPQAVPLELSGRPRPDELRVRVVRSQHIEVAVDDQHAERRLVDHGPVALFALLKCHDRALAGIDVAVEDEDALLAVGVDEGRGSGLVPVVVAVGVADAHLDRVGTARSKQLDDPLLGPRAIVGMREVTHRAVGDVLGLPARPAGAGITGNATRRVDLEDHLAGLANEGLETRLVRACLPYLFGRLELLDARLGARELPALSHERHHQRAEHDAPARHSDHRPQ